MIEPAAGVDRPMLAFLLDAYAEDEAPNAKGKLEKRTVLRLDRRLAPVKVAVLPLSRNADLSPEGPRPGRRSCASGWNVDFDDAGAIGRRYRRQDEIGTPFCVTVDFDTLDDQAVTVRERDSMKQERIGLDQRARRTWPSACPAAEPPPASPRQRRRRPSRARASGPGGPGCARRSPRYPDRVHGLGLHQRVVLGRLGPPLDGLLLLGAELRASARPPRRAALSTSAVRPASSPAQRALRLPGVLDAVRHTDPVRPATRPATGSSLPAAPVHRRRGPPFLPASRAAVVIRM